MTLRDSLVRTRGVRVNLAVSLTLGDAIHVGYCPMRIAVVISQSILLANILKWTGAAYLSFIGTKASLRQEAHLGRDRRCIENYRAHGHARGGSLGLSDEPPRSQNDAAVLTHARYLDYPPGNASSGQESLRPDRRRHRARLVGFVTAFFSTAPAKCRFNVVAHWVQRVTGTVLMMLEFCLAIARATH